MSDSITALRPIILSAARKAAPFESELQKELVQNGWVTALECQKTYRGDEDANLATYAYNAIKLSMYHTKARQNTPVYVPRYKSKDAWNLRKKNPTIGKSGGDAAGAANDGPADDMDLLACPARDPEAETNEINAMVRKHIEAANHPEAMRDMLLLEQSAAEVAATYGLTVSSVRQMAANVCSAIKRDRALLAVFAPSRVRASDVGPILGFTPGELRDLLTDDPSFTTHTVNGVLYLDKKDLLRAYKNDARVCSALMAL